MTTSVVILGAEGSFGSGTFSVSDSSSSITLAEAFMSGGQVYVEARAIQQSNTGQMILQDIFKPLSSFTVDPLYVNQGEDGHFFRYRLMDSLLIENQTATVSVANALEMSGFTVSIVPSGYSTTTLEFLQHFGIRHS